MKFRRTVLVGASIVLMTVNVSRVHAEKPTLAGDCTKAYKVAAEACPSASDAQRISCQDLAHRNYLACLKTSPPLPPGDGNPKQHNSGCALAH